MSYIYATDAAIHLRWSIEDVHWAAEHNRLVSFDDSLDDELRVTTHSVERLRRFMLRNQTALGNPSNRRTTLLDL